MKTRLLAMGAAVFIAAALAACGGGGGGGTPPPPPSSSTPTPTVAPTATPTANPFGCVGASPFASARRAMANPPHPIGNGDTFQYTGTIQTTYVQSTPCAQPTATSSASASVSVTNSSASGPSGATADQRSVETDAFPTLTTQTTTDLYVTANSSSYDLFESRTTDESGNVVTTTYANPQQLDALPETSGQSWQNSPAATFTESITDGTQISRNVASDGSYVDTENFPDGTVATISVTGSATGNPINGGGSYQFNYSTGTVNTITFGPPQAGSIVLTATTNTQPGQQTVTIPAWFNVPSSYITDAFVDNGPVSFDSHCAVNAAIGTQGNQIVETYNVIDPVLGYTETRTTTSYVVAGFGPACVVISDTLNSYYDYNLDTTLLIYPSMNGQPNSVDTISEYLGMTAPSGPYTQSRSRAASAVSTSQVATRIAAIAHLREIQRAQRIERLATALRLKHGEVR